MWNASSLHKNLKMFIPYYLDLRGGRSNFHTLILKTIFQNKTYIMALGYAGGGVYEEFFGQFFTTEKSECIGKVSNSIGPYQWEKSIRISYDYDTGEGISNVNELYQDLDENEQKISDIMFSKLEELIFYGEKTEEIQSDFPILKEISFSNISSEVKGIFKDEGWDDEYMYITQESFWPLSLRFID